MSVVTTSGNQQTVCKSSDGDSASVNASDGDFATWISSGASKSSDGKSNGKYAQAKNLPSDASNAAIHQQELAGNVTYFCNKCEHLPSTSTTLTCSHFIINLVFENPVAMVTSENEMCNEKSTVGDEGFSLPKRSALSTAHCFCVPDIKPDTNTNACSSMNSNSHIAGINSNLKIGSLNVCGLKPRLNYPEFIQMVENYDIFCVLETKLDEFDVIDLPNNTHLSKPGSEKSYRKSGGLGICIHDSLKDNVEILDSNCDFIFWISLLLNKDTKLVLGALYVPPEQSRCYSDSEYFELEKGVSCKRFVSDYVLIMGDANGHTSNLPDYVQMDDQTLINIGYDVKFSNEINFVNFLQYYISHDSLTKCKRINKRGQTFLNPCKNNDLFIHNGRLFSDKEGQFTFRDLAVIG